MKEIAKRLGDNGKAYGIDIYSGMLEVSRKKLVKAGLMNRVELYCGDATEMPYDDAKFDAVFSSFTLELFDTPEIPKVLSEITRVLRPKGRFGLVSMSKEEGNSFITRLYEWFHTKFPEYIDCRPIYIEQSLKDAGLEIKHKEKMKMFGLPIEIVIAEK